MTPRADRGGALILCIDDDATVLASLERMLHSGDFRTGGATSPTQALESEER